MRANGAGSSPLSVSDRFVWDTGHHRDAVSGVALVVVGEEHYDEETCCAGGYGRAPLSGGWA